MVPTKHISIRFGCRCSAKFVSPCTWRYGRLGSGFFAHLGESYSSASQPEWRHICGTSANLPRKKPRNTCGFFGTNPEGGFFGINRPKSSDTTSCAVGLCSGRPEAEGYTR